MNTNGLIFLFVTGLFFYGMLCAITLERYLIRIEEKIDKLLKEQAK